MSNYPEIRKFPGLFLQANSFENVPDGAFEIAEDIVLQNDDIIQKRRGQYEYYDPSTGTLNQLFEYQNKLLAVYNDKVGHFDTETGSAPNEQGVETINTGASVLLSGGRTARADQQNNNFYFTTNNGVQKLEAHDSAIRNAGVPGGLDIYPSLDGTSGWFGATGPAEVSVGYRVVFGRRDSNNNLLLGAPSDSSYVFNSSPGTPTDVSLEISIPEEIDSVSDEWFVQIYRSSIGEQAGSITPELVDFKIIAEETLTATQITNHALTYLDTIPVDTRDQGSELYTNVNSREGEEQANKRPPLCEDIATFKEHVFYANTTTRHLRLMNVIDATKISNGDTFSVQIGAGSAQDYYADDAFGNQLTSTSAALSAGTTYTITASSNNFTDGDTVYISDVGGGTATPGVYTISNRLAGSFDVDTSEISGGTLGASVKFEGLERSTGERYWFYDKTSLASVQLAETAFHLVKAVNRNPNESIYANYATLANGTPGQMRFEAKGFGEEIRFSASSNTTGEAFDPNVTTTATDTVSTADDFDNVIFVSKISEPEAVPAVNFFTVGSRNKAIKRILALRDSLIILKEDGVYRLTGDTVSNFVITALDDTIFIRAANSAEKINNQIACLSNQGIVLITDTSVQIISRRIEDVIQPILSSSELEAQTNAVAYESDRLYLMSTIKPGSAVADVVYVYNVVNDTWVTWTTNFTGGTIGPSDKLYLIRNNEIKRERKVGSRLNYCEQNYAVTINTVTADKLGANITLPGGVVPSDGDVIVKDEGFSRISSVSVNGATFDVTFLRITNLEAGDSEVLYSNYTSTMKFVPYHGGKVGQMKQFGQMQIHTKQQSLSRLRIFYSGYAYGGSTETEWDTVAVDGEQGGWGFEPWGFFPWGNEDGIAILTGTRPASVVRLYIPRFQQRTTFIQPTFVHEDAGESMQIQAIAYAVRAYKERVSR